MAELKCFKVFAVIGHGKRLSDFDNKVRYGRFPYVGDDDRVHKLGQAIVFADNVKWSFDDDRPGNNVNVVVSEDNEIVYSVLDDNKEGEA